MCRLVLFLGLALIAAPVAAAPRPSSGALAEARVSPSTGAFSTEIPIIVPNYYDLEPELSLVYNSGAGDGFVGMGWGLSDQSFIERASPGQGAPDYTGNDIFLLDGEELTAACTTFGGTHCAHHQDYQRIQQDTANNKWYVWEKDGTKKTYTWLYCVANCAHPTFNQIFRWALKTVQDTNGNTVTYNYWCESAQNCYLDNISYNGNTIKLWREARPDDISFTNGVYVGHTNYRLKTIVVKVGDDVARAYKLTYTASRNTQRSLLTSVQQYGSDATLDSSGTVTGGTSLPAVTMTYQAGGVGFSHQSFNASVGGEGANIKDYLADVDGDGKSDLVRIWKNGDNAYAQVNPSNGSGFPDQSFNASVGNWNAAFKDYFVDVNGDGKSDLVRIYDHNNSGTAYAQVNPSNGSGFPSQSFNASIGSWSTNIKDYFADVNGDGRSDLVRIWKNGANAYAQVNLSDGSGFPHQSFNASVGGWDTDTKDYFADINGDGKSDLVRIWQNGDNAFAQVNLSNGSGFPTRAWNASVGGWNTTFEDFLSDVNGDGKSDLVRIYNHNSSGTAYAQVNLSDGNGFPHQIWNASIGAWDTTNIKDYSVDVNGDGRNDLVRIWKNENNAYAQVNLFDGTGFTGQDWNSSVGGWNTDTKDYFGDVNGDGKSDLIRLWPNGTHTYAQVNPSDGLPPDLLTSLRNDRGGTTTIEYTPSSAWENTYLPMGMILQTVSSVTVQDGRSVSGETTYRYSGALWSASEREFLGFRYSKAVIDTQGTYVETYNRQTVNSAGHPDTVYIRNSAGQVYNRMQYTYDENDSPPYTSLLTREQTYECNLHAACRQIRSDFTYDQYANTTYTIEHGDADLAGDERTTVRAYAPNTMAYIVSLPKSEEVYSATTIAPDKLVKRTVYYYDGATESTTPPSVGNLTRTDAWNNQTGDYVTSTQQYDAYGNVISATDARGSTTTTSYDPTHHLFPTQTCNALSQCTSQAWDYTLGVTTAITDSNSAVTHYVYDPLARKTSETDPAGNVTTWQYLDIGNPNSQHVRMTKPDGSNDGLWTETYTDGLGRTYKEMKEGPQAGVTYRDTVYNDATDRPQKQSLWRQSGDAALWETYTYDGAGRLVRTAHPDGNNTTVQYTTDTHGKPYVVTLDELGHEQATWHDAYDNLSQVREKNGADYYTTTYEYNTLDKLVKVTDHAGNTTTFSWDSLGRKLSMSDPDLGAWSYTYDAGGLLLTQTDAKSQTITFTYDGLGRMRTKVAGGQTSAWYYDEAGYGASNGRLTRVTYPAGSESHIWSNLGLETATTRCVESTCQTTSGTYDGLHRVSRLTYPDGEVVSYTYDSAGNLQAVSGYVDAMTWSPTDQLTSLTYANGTTTDYTYDPKRLWLTSARVTLEATTLYTSTYTYNGAGLVKTMTQGTPTPATLNYTYDDLDRLTGVSGAQTQTFTYDALGNMTSNSLVGSYTYGDAAHKHAVTRAGANTYAYDANGNMTAGAGRTLTWDAENRLVQVTQQGAITRQTDNAGQPRIEQTVIPQGGGGPDRAMLYLPLIRTAQSGTTTTFAYDAGEQRIKKTQGTNTTLYFSREVEQVNGALIQYYYAGPVLVAKKDAAGTKTWYHADRLGSIRLMTDASGHEVKDYDYQPFGETQASSGAMRNERGFTGHITDSETDLIYMVARYYDPQLGRFLSADSVVSDWGNPQDLNPYSYVLNNPISNTDPTGHWVPGPDGRPSHPQPRHAGSHSRVPRISNTMASILPPPLGIMLQVAGILEDRQRAKHHHSPAPHQPRRAPGDVSASSRAIITYDKKHRSSSSISVLERQQEPTRVEGSQWLERRVKGAIAGAVAYGTLGTIAGAGIGCAAGVMFAGVGCPVLGIPLAETVGFWGMIGGGVYGAIVGADKIGIEGI